MKISARNQLKGTIIGVVKGSTTSHVQIDIGGAIVMASITNEAVEELKLAKGQPAIAVIKASDVLVAVAHRRPGARERDQAGGTGRCGSRGDRCRAGLHRPHPHALDMRMVTARAPAPSGRAALPDRAVRAWPEALDGIAAFEPIEVLYWLHLSWRDLVRQSPANDGTTRGTFALRSPVRPNPIGTSIVAPERVEGAMLFVCGLIASSARRSST